MTEEMLLSRAGERRINGAMKSFQSWFFKILWWLTFVVIFLAVVLLVNRDWFAKEIMAQKIRATTGLEAEIGDFSFSILDSEVTLGACRIFNPAQYGGTLFLDVPELHIEYDRAALRRHEIHITLMRVNLHEVDVVKNAAAETNIMSYINTLAPQKSNGGVRTFAPLGGYKFTGIDLLNLSVGMVKFVDLKDQRRNRMVAIGIQNKIYTNVVTSADFPGLSGELWVRGGYIVGLPVHPPIRKPNPEPAAKTP